MDGNHHHHHHQKSNVVRGGGIIVGGRWRKTRIKAMMHEKRPESAKGSVASKHATNRRISRKRNKYLIGDLIGRHHPVFVSSFHPQVKCARWRTAAGRRCPSSSPKSPSFSSSSASPSVRPVSSTPIFHLRCS